MTRRVVLVGLPGVGKTTVGAALAERLGVPFFDLDALVAADGGRAAAEILREDGEAALREAECAALRRAQGDEGVLATGGGTVESDEARALLRDEPLVVLLTASQATLVARVERGGDRPLVDGAVASRLAALAARREPLYHEVATTAVDAEGTVDDVAARVAEQLVRG